jgi:hypothetical protein
MGDWLAIADIPELAYLITEKPQSTASPAASFGAAPTTGGGSPAVANVASASFEGAEGGAVDWKPSAASALSSLVQDEISTKPEPEEVPAPAPSPALDGMPSFGAGDVFGGGAPGASGAPAADAFAAPAAPAAPMGDMGGGGGWTVPETKKSGGHTGLIVAIVLLAIVVLGVGGGAFYWFGIRGQGQQQVETPTPPDTQLAQKGPTNEAPKPAGAEAAAPEKADETEAPKEDPSAPEPEAKEAKSEPKKTSKSTRTRNKPSGKPSGKPKPKKDDIDKVFDAPKANVKASLTRDDIFNGVKKNAGKLKPCLTAARSKGEVLPGKYKFVLDWRIQPSGKVTGGKLKGPKEVMKTSLPSCFGRVMNTWKFAVSKSGAPISNFPLPITVR